MTDNKLYVELLAECKELLMFSSEFTKQYVNDRVTEIYFCIQNNISDLADDYTGYLYSILNEAMNRAGKNLEEQEQFM